MKPTFDNLVKVTAARAGETAEAAECVLRAFFTELAAAVWATGRVSVPGLGVFARRSRKARSIANPVTGEPMTLPRHQSVHARVAKSWRVRG